MAFRITTRQQILVGGFAAAVVVLAPVGTFTAAPAPDPGTCTVADETRGSHAVVCAPDVRGANENWPNPEDLAGDN